MIESGILGQQSLVAQTYTTLVRIPADQGVAPTVTIRLLNNDQANASTVRLYACPPTYLDAADPTALRAIVPLDKPMAAGGMMEDSGVVIGPGWAIVAWSSAPATAVVWGHAK